MIAYGRPIGHNNWAEISVKSIAHNMKKIREVTSPSAKIMALVKANAYGHGITEVAKIVLENGADALAVARVNEGVVLRRSGVEAPILILGYTPPAIFSALTAYQLTQTVFSYAYAQSLQEFCSAKGVRVKVHLKLDTGMGRIGLLAQKEESLTEVLAIARLSRLELEGIYTHFASADAGDDAFVKQQYQHFLSFIQSLTKKGLEIPLRHCANSAAILRYPETHLDMVRPGIIIYGLCPSLEMEKDCLGLQPAMCLKAMVTMVKQMPANSPIGYGCTYITPQPTLIATLAIGYGDGYPRSLSSRGEVLIQGQRAPVVGKICMDQCMVDIGHIPGVVPGDEAVLFGCQGTQKITIQEVADKIGTIHYELITMIADRVPRVYTQ